MLNSVYLVEFIGCFMLFSVFLTNANAIPLGLTLAAICSFGPKGHYNPVASVLMFLKNKLSEKDLIGYVLAQLLGGVAASNFAKLAGN